MFTRSVLTLAFLILLGGSSYVSPAAADGGPLEDKKYALSLYWGGLTDGHWEESVIFQTDFVESNLLVGAFTLTYLTAESGRWSMEMEANVGKHFGDQNHWEFNLPIFGGRWHAFPWDRLVETSTAFGLGLSYATQKPEIEQELDGSSERVLVYWHYELAFGLPEKDWTTFFRLHHRSPGYGLFGSDGGSNALTLGIRFFL